MQQLKTIEDYLEINSSINRNRLIRDFIETQNTVGKLDVELIKKTNLNGPSFAWQQNDVHSLIEDARSKNLAVVGWQVQYRFPNAICDLYWLNHTNDPRIMSESWNDYVERCSGKSLEAFMKTINTIDIHADAINSFDYIANLSAEEKLNLREFQFFEIYLKNQEHEQEKS